MKFFLFFVAALLIGSSCQKSASSLPDITYSCTLASSGPVTFKGLCTWTAEYVDTNFDLVLDSKNQRVRSADITTTMKEKLITGSCTPAAQQNGHVYALSAYAINGNSIVVYFKQDENSFPQNSASFTGSITSIGISGMLTFYRKSDGIFCKVEMVIQLKKAA